MSGIDDLAQHFQESPTEGKVSNHTESILPKSNKKILPNCTAREKYHKNSDEKT
jgi:ribosomal protein S30